MNWTRRGLLAAGAVSGAAASLAAAHPADAALWEVRDGRAKVFLFGGGGPMRTPWRSPRIEAALNESTVFWKETPEPAPGAASVLIARGIDPARPLSTWLTPTDRERVAAAATAVGSTLAFLEPFRPWLAAQYLDLRYYPRFGFKAVNGSDPTLTAIAKAAEKPIRTEFPDTAAFVALELGFSRMAEVQLLRRTLDEIEAGPDFTERAAAAWATGDRRMDMQEVKRMARVYPELYQEYVVTRNRLWPGRIRAMLDNGGTSFVLVGSGHLVGPDSVQNQLALAGMKARLL